MDIINSFLIIFTLIFLGFILGKKKLFDSNHVQAFELFLFKVAIPCSLFSATSIYCWDDLVNTNYICAYLSYFASISVILFLYFKKYNISEILIKIFAAGYVNAAIYTMPVVTLSLNDPRSAIIGNIIQVVIIQSVFITIICFLKNRSDSIIKRLSNIFTNPLIIMSLIELLLSYFRISPNFIIASVAKNLGIGASSMALFTFGLAISSIKLNRETISKDILFISIIKTMIHPLAAFVVGKYIFNLTSYWLNSLIIASSSPTAFVVYIISK